MSEYSKLLTDVMNILDKQDGLVPAYYIHGSVPFEKQYRPTRVKFQRIYPEEENIKRSAMLVRDAVYLNATVLYKEKNGKENKANIGPYHLSMFKDFSKADLQAGYANWLSTILRWPFYIRADKVDQIKKSINISQALTKLVLWGSNVELPVYDKSSKTGLYQYFEKLTSLVMASNQANLFDFETLLEAQAFFQREIQRQNARDGMANAFTNVINNTQAAQTVHGLPGTFVVNLPLNQAQVAPAGIVQEMPDTAPANDLAWIDGFPEDEELPPV